MMKLNYNINRSKNPIKIQINEFFARETSKRKLGKVLFLESRALLTYKTLFKFGIKPDDMIVPNPVEEDFKIISKYIKGAKQVFLDEWLNTYKIEYESSKVFGGMFHKPTYLKSVWFDYMCSIQGNEDIKPFRDIEKLFSKKILFNNSIFGYTFCVRHPKVIYERENIEKAEEFTQTVASKNNYHLIRLGRTWVYNGMFTQFFQVKTHN